MYGKRKFQLFFEKLYHFSKFGKNIGLPIDIYSSGEINFIRHIAGTVQGKNSFVSFDIGANHGIYTDYILQLVPGEKQCFLFEPQAKLYDQLCAKYSGARDVMIIKKGCGSKQAMVELFSFGEDTVASVYNTFKGTVQPKSCETIDIIRLEDFFREQGLAFIDLVKIDVEGHELEVIKGMVKYLQEGKIKIIQFEFGSFNIASRTFFKDFWDMLHTDFRLYRLLKDGMIEIKDYSPDLEIFDTTNYAAILKLSND